MACADKKHKENHRSSRCLGGWTPYESMTMHQLLSSPCIVHRTLPLPILGPALSPSQSFFISSLSLEAVVALLHICKLMSLNAQTDLIESFMWSEKSS